MERRPRAGWIVPAALALLAGGASPRLAPADDPVLAGAANGAPAALPFSDLADRVRVGPAALVGSLAVLPLWAARDMSHVSQGPGAWVGLVGTDVVLLDLPVPIGLGVVRISNSLPAPLFLPRGEALVSPSGASRIVDRPVWVAAGASAYVPVAQATDEGAPGPYQPSADRASPTLLRALRAHQWPQVVREWNATLGVPAERLLDPVAGYQSPAFSQRVDSFLAELAGLRATVPSPLVGVAVVDEGGVATIFLQADAARFRALWTGIARGIALDGVVRGLRGWAAMPREAAARAAEETLAALRELRSDPAVRPAFGEGEQMRWPSTDDPARWYGLAVGGMAVEATYHRPAIGAPILLPPPPTGPPPEPPPSQARPLPRFDHRPQPPETPRPGGPGGGEAPRPGVPAGGGSAPRPGMPGAGGMDGP